MFLENYGVPVVAVLSVVSVIIMLIMPPPVFLCLVFRHADGGVDNI